MKLTNICCRMIFVTFVFCYLFTQNLASPLIKPGTFEEWREALPFEAGAELPECKEKCSEKCRSEYKGVAMCSSFLESIDQEPEFVAPVGNTTTTMVQFITHK